MTFNTRDLRRGMDVYSVDGVYLGTVVYIVRREVRSDEPAQSEDDSGGDSQSSPDCAFNGETLGPMPTGALGNQGPRQQSSATAYGSTLTGRTPTRVARPTELIVVRGLVALNWATLKPRLRRIPVSDVQILSFERIILSKTAAELG